MGGPAARQGPRQATGVRASRSVASASVRAKVLPAPADARAEVYCCKPLRGYASKRLAAPHPPQAGALVRASYITRNYAQLCGGTVAALRAAAQLSGLAPRIICVMQNARGYVLVAIRPRRVLRREVFALSAAPPEPPPTPAVCCARAAALRSSAGGHSSRPPVRPRKRGLPQAKAKAQRSKATATARCSRRPRLRRGRG